MPDQKQLRWSKETRTWVPETGRLFAEVHLDEKHGVVLVIDGVQLTMPDLQRTLGTHEGWYLEMKFFDPTDVEAPPVPGRM